MKRQSGFTLIELLAVVAIIALLMAILMPALGAANRAANDVTCRARLKQWGACYKMYTDENDGEFTGGTHYEGPSGRGAWFSTLLPYYKDAEMLLCPAATRIMEHSKDFGTFKAWEYNYGGDIRIGSYCENSWICSQEWTNNNPARPRVCYWREVNRVRNPNKVPVLGDGTHFDAWVTHYDVPPPFMDAAGIGNILATGYNMQHFCINRHGGSINMLFADWTVRRVGLKELWTLKWHAKWELGGPTATEYDPSEYTIAGQGGDVEACELLWAEEAPWLAKYPVH